MFKSIRHHVRNLQPGATFKVASAEVRGGVLRNYASAAAVDFPGRKYSVHYDRDTQTYTVTRHA